ncbi:MAG TPA: mechanosensitive ion channel family protein [Candidatus Limnocylindrales bacterium]|nr:mechanosensitive ion channel family protein [Candidatus Limnocylindrales bacterium]
MPDLTTIPADHPIWTAGQIVVIVVVAIVALRLVRLFVQRLVRALMDREATEGTAQELSAVEVKRRTDTIATLAINVLTFVIVVVAAIMILDKLSYDVAPAVAGLGVVGIAVGFGAQSLVRDYFTGALILIENQFSKGDVVSIAGVTGTVEDFSLRRTTLRDLDGVVHTVPNGQIAVTSNRTRTWARINQDVTVAYGTDVDRAIAVVDEVGQAMADDPALKRRILERPRVERVEALAELGITLKILGSVRAGEQWSVGGELRKRLLDAFRASGIEIPQPRHVVIARDEAAAAPAVKSSPGPSQDELAEPAD